LQTAGRFEKAQNPDLAIPPMEESIRIVACRSPQQIARVRRLFVEYTDFLGVDLSFQDFEQELNALPGPYAPPTGALFLAQSATGPAGCAGLRRLEAGICEMKRLYVRPAYRGSGLGRRLAERVIDTAAEMGYRLMRLDTLDRLTEAIELYTAMGFRRRAPYYENPLPGVLYWERRL
jgi:ribosomal protein S18 acetylase RimI-like enzyme